jgi:hypothetical protein
LAYDAGKVTTAPTSTKTDFEQIFDALGQAKVRYVVVGGVAVVLQGHPRLTADLDLVVSLEPANALRAMKALESLDYRPRAPVKADDFADPAIRQQWISEKGLAVFSLWSTRFQATEVDVFVAEPLPFEELWNRASKIEMGGTSIAVASIEDLISMKARVGRPKDLQDIDELRKLSALRTRGP